MNATMNRLLGPLSFVCFLLPCAMPVAQGQGILQRLEERVRQRLQEGPILPAAPASPGDTANQLPSPAQRAPDQRPTLGVEVDELAGGGTPGDLVVAVVHPGTAAAAAGLQTGDRIVRFGGVPVDSVEDLAGVLSRSQPGDRLLLVVERNGEPTQLTVTLAEPTAVAPNAARPAAPELGAPPADAANQRMEARSFPTDPADAGLPSGGRLGLTVEDPPTQRGRRLQRGALVTEVTPGAPGDRAGLQTGDLIVSLDGALIPDARTLIFQMRQTRPGQRVDLQYVRDQRLGRATVTLAGPDGVLEQPAAGGEATGDAANPNGAAGAGTRQPAAGGSVLGDVGSMLGGLFGGQQPNPIAPNTATPDTAAPDTAAPKTETPDEAAPETPAPTEAETLPSPDADVPPSLSQSELEDASEAELRSTVRQLEAANRRLEQRLQQLEAQMQAILEARSGEATD